MKITLASFDHFHLLNQAQQLHVHGFLEQYLSTRVRPEIEKLPFSVSRSCYPLHYALRLMQRYPHWVGGNHFYLQLCRIFDLWVKSKVPKETDILTILSGAGLSSFKQAKRKKILTVVECGSTHTDFQNKIILEEYQRNGITKPLFPEAYRSRIKEEFSVADYIQIPTRFVGNTFIENNIPESKLLYAQYGTDVALFKPKKTLDASLPFRVICPSGVNLRKGARLLAAAWKKLNWKDAELVWIGYPGPETQHLFKDPIPGLVWKPYLKHDQLAELYRQCDVFILPSFEEGLARVLIEAAACGLPLIVTPNTGAEDFLSCDDPEGWIIPINDVDAICDSLIQARANREKTFQLGQRAVSLAQKFTWEAYGQRVIANYKKILGS